MAADASVLALMAGVMSLIFLPRQSKFLGWVCIGAAIALIFVSGAVILRPTSLWTFFLSAMSFAAGYELMTKGRIRL